MLGLLLATALSVGPWEDEYLPLSPGRGELKTGLGTTWSQGRFSPLPAFSFRLGVTRVLTLAAPLAAELLLADANGYRPGITVSGGLAGLGFSSVFGVIVQPFVGPALFWRGHDLLLQLGAFANASIEFRSRLPVFLYAGGRGLLAYRAFEGLTLSAWSTVQWQVSPASSHEGGIVVGSTARLHLAGTWYLELDTTVAPQSEVLNATLDVVWMPEAWEAGDQYEVAQ